MHANVKRLHLKVKQTKGYFIYERPSRLILARSINILARCLRLNAAKA